MNISKKLTRVMLLAAAALLPAMQAHAADLGSTDRIVIKYKSDVSAAQAAAAPSPARVQALEARGGAKVRGLVKTTGTGASVFALESAVPVQEARAIAARIAQDPSVAYAEPDVRVTTHAIPNDSWATQQWSLMSSDQVVGGTNLFNAWALAGTRKVVVAVVDTGSLSHVDLSANEIVGYDFITDPTTAGDSDGRDGDPTDTGDFCTSTAKDSSWHGMRVASQIAALGNNGIGIAGGAAFNAQVLQVRALGRCGGYLSDVADAVLWSAGGTVAGVRANTTPAQVINMSLGASAGTACYSYMQDAVSFAVSQNVVVVAAAGNEGAADVGAPANCSGVIAVGAHTASGDLASYSNHSSLITLTAPGGGNCMVQTTSCISTPTISLGNNGKTVAGSNIDASYFAGTSAATPHVSAAVALLLAANPMLTPAQVKAYLVSTARKHIAGTYCAANTTQCGAGMLDAYAALVAATAPVAVPGLTVTAPSKAVAGNASVPLTVAVAGGNAGYTFAWTQTAGPAVTLRNADQATASFTAPATRGADMTFKVRVSASASVFADETAVIRVNNAPVVTSASVASATAGAAFSFTLAGSDADSDALTFHATGLPTGMTLNGNTLSWASPVVGTYVLTVSAVDGASDGSGDSALQTLTVSVVAASSGSGTTGGSGGGSGGGGSLSVFGLLLLAGAAFFPRIRSR